MFLSSSRYAKTDTEEIKDAKGRTVKVIKLRRLNRPAAQAMTVDNSHQLDVMAKRQYKDGTKFWHIADANTELEANALVQRIGRTIHVPKS